MKTLEDIMNELNSVSTLIRKTLVYKSPMYNGGLEYRVAYFKDNFEANIWEADMDKKYYDLKIEHHVYTDVIHQ